MRFKSWIMKENQGEDLLNALLDYPLEMDRWLVYADYLEESGSSQIVTDDVRSAIKEEFKIKFYLEQMTDSGASGFFCTNFGNYQIPGINVNVSLPWIMERV